MLEVMYLDHSTSAGCGVTSTDMHFNILPFLFLILRKHEKKNPSTSYCICCMNIAECSLSIFCFRSPDDLWEHNENKDRSTR